MEAQKGWIAEDLAALAEAKQALETKHPNWERLDEHEPASRITSRPRRTSPTDCWSQAALDHFLARTS